MNPKPRDRQTTLVEELLQPVPAPGGAAMPPALVRALIVDILGSGEIDVVVPPDDGTRFRCDFLENGANATLELQRGDLVLVMPPAGLGQPGCVLGRIGRYRAPQRTPSPLPSCAVIEATEMLTLKCGESSIDLRKDGKLMIRGNDVLSRARRTQRIKGGTVAIN